MATLPTRQLGRTGLRVTTLGFGAMELRGEPRGRSIDSKEAGEVLNAVLDAGINYIDTSIDYGASEERIGEHIAHRRAEYYLASKRGCLQWPGCAGGSGASGRATSLRVTTLLNGVNQSLRRMKTDYLDLVQFHASPSKATLEENSAVETLLDLQREGKIRFLGMSGTLPNIVDQIEMGVFDVFQIPCPRCSASTKTRSRWRRTPVPASSSVEAPRRVASQRAGSRAPSGTGGSRQDSTICSKA